MLGGQVKSGGDGAPNAKWRGDLFIILHHNFNCPILPQTTHASEKRPFSNLIENGRFITDQFVRDQLTNQIFYSLKMIGK